VAANRVLFVDDEPKLRQTYAAILALQGFEVRVAATVAEALTEITTHNFDVLVSDLNIGQPGDGYTVVSAMRRTQPDCINFIITGFPAFESALAAIKNQVDDYLVKPANVDELVGAIQHKLREHHPSQLASPERLSRLLRENLETIREETVRRMKADPALREIPISDELRGDFLSPVLAEIANQLDSASPEAPTPLAIQLSRRRGVSRLRCGYQISMLVNDTVILEGVVYDLVRQRLLALDTSNLVTDLQRFHQSLDAQLQLSVQAFWDDACEGRKKMRAAG
jgi:ActR/RegA family two-component response regulator